MAADHNQELFKPLSSAFDIDIIETIQVKQDLPWQRRNYNSQCLQFKDLPERDKVAVPSSDSGLSFSKSRDIRSTYDLVICVRFSSVVGLRIAYLEG